MISGKNPMLLLIEAIKCDDAGRVHDLFQRFPEQRDKFTPFAGAAWLHYAASRGSNSVLEYLLSSGESINRGDRHDGARAICFAAQQDRAKSAKLLIERGIDLETSASIRNPLFSAIVGRSPEIVMLLLRAGINARAVYNSKTMSNMDAVAFALMRGEQECADIIARWNSGGDEVAANQTLAEADKIAEQNAYAKR